MRKAYFYVGSNNKTHKLEKAKIERIVSRYFEGFTAFEVVGYWRGNKEKTLKVEVITDEKDSMLRRVGKEVKNALEKQSVILEVVESNCAFIS